MNKDKFQVRFYGRMGCVPVSRKDKTIVVLNEHYALREKITESHIGYLDLSRMEKGMEVAISRPNGRLAGAVLEIKKGGGIYHAGNWTSDENPDVPRFDILVEGVWTGGAEMLFLMFFRRQDLCLDIIPVEGDICAEWEEFFEGLNSSDPIKNEVQIRFQQIIAEWIEKRKGKK